MSYISQVGCWGNRLHSISSLVVSFLNRNVSKLPLKLHLLREGLWGMEEVLFLFLQVILFFLILFVEYIFFYLSNILS